MTGKLLVAYATKYGATMEIAEKIGKTLNQAGFKTDVLLVNKVDSLNQYQAVVLGSAVYAGHWRKEAVEFLELRQGALAQMPVWIFSSGPTGEGDPIELTKGWKFPEGLKPVAERIQPRDIAVFHGEMDMQKLNIGEKLIIRGIKAPTGDFRDWDAITQWAAGIAEALKHENPESHPAT